MTKVEWLEKTLLLISKVGINEIKIDILCKKFKVTKGSFYHHFKNQKEFINNLLEYWYEIYTVQIIKELKNYENDPIKQIEIINTIIYSKNLDIEIEFRAWGIRNPLVVTFIEKIDKERIEAITKIQNKLFPQNDSKYNADISLYIYSQFIGSLFIQPRTSKEKQKDLDNLFLSLLQRKK